MDNEVLRIEHVIETPSGAYTEGLKRRRAQLKDRLYGLFTKERGYTCTTLVEARGSKQADEAYAKDALVTVVEGGLNIEMHGVGHLLEPGDELYIPRGARFTVRNTGADAMHCFLGPD